MPPLFLQPTEGILALLDEECLRPGEVMIHHIDLEAQISFISTNILILCLFDILLELERLNYILLSTGK